MKTKTAYKNHQRLFELIRNNKNADKVIYEISKRAKTPNCSIYLSQEYDQKIISIILDFNRSDNCPNIKFILSSDSQYLAIKGSSFGKMSYDDLVKFLTESKKEAMEIITEINIEMAFD